jgi:hypothetical protein
VFELGTITAGTNTLNVPGTNGTSTFVLGDVGKAIQVTGAGVGGSDLYTTIETFVSSTQVTLTANASTTSKRASVFWYPPAQDDTDVIQTAINSTTESVSSVLLEAGIFVISSGLVASQFLLAFRGQGINQTVIIASGIAFASDGLDVSLVTQGVSLEDFTIKGPGLSIASSTAIVTAWSQNSNLSTLTANNPFSAGQPIALAGFQNTGAPYNDVFATVLASGLSSTQFEFDIVPGPLTGTTASLNASGATVTATGLANLTPNLAFLSITITGAEAGNDGTFTMTPWVSASSIEWQNASAPAGADSNNGAISWIVGGSGTDTGVAHLDYSGIAFTFGQQTTQTLNYATVRNVRSMRWPGDGFKCASAIVSEFDHCIALLNNGNGFAEYYVLQVGSTSTKYDTCYANANYQAGYYLHETAYDAFTNCAADSNGISYYLATVRNSAFLGCGSEATYYQNQAYPGWHWYLHGGQGCAIIAPYCSADSGQAYPVEPNQPGCYLVMDNQASNHFVQGMTMGGYEDLPTTIAYIHFSCANNTVWEPFFSNNTPSFGTNFIDAGTADTLYWNGAYQTTLVADNGATISGVFAAVNNATIGSYITVGGGTVATSGLIRVALNGTLTILAGVKTGGTTFEILGVTASGSIVIGDGVNNNNVNLNVPSGGALEVQQAGNNAYVITPLSSGATTAKAAATVTSVIYGQLTVASGTGAPTTMQAQATSSGTGGSLTLEGGTGTTAYGQTNVGSSFNLGQFTQAMTTLDVALSVANSAKNIILVTGTISGTPKLTFAESPTLGLFKIVRNNGSGTIAVGWATGTTINVAANAAVIVGSDGTNAVLIGTMT